MKQNDSRMKAAEREINRLTYAFNILKQAGYPIIPVPPRLKKGEEEEKKEEGIDIETLSALTREDLPEIRTVPGKEERVLITRVFNGRYEGWHPTLGEFDLKDPRQGNARGRSQA